MSIAEIVLAVMWIGVTAYALLAGADFGGGMWDLLAGGPRKGRDVRVLIERSIGPVWEANHVWLIFVLVVLWTGFPSTFASVASTLYIPLTAVAIGVILRGAAFAFRKSVTTIEAQRFFGATFAASSVITPFFLGTIAGAVASGRVPAGNAAGNIWTSWWNPTSILGGVLAVVTCAFLASVYLYADAHRQNLGDLVAYFRRRAIVSGLVAGAIAIPGIVILSRDAPDLFDGLKGRGLPLVIGSAVAGITSLILVTRGRYAPARIAAAGAVTAIVWGWAAGQYPYLLEQQVTIEEGAAPDATMNALLGVLIVGSIIVGPALYWLFKLTTQDKLAEKSKIGIALDEEGTT